MHSVPAIFTACVNEFKERYVKMLPISYPEWPATVCCNVEDSEVHALVIKQKENENSVMSFTPTARNMLMLSLNEGVKLYDMLNETFSDTSKSTKLLLCGAPGIGKTTSTRSICIKWSKGKLLEQIKLVILVCLRDRQVREIRDLFEFGVIDDKKLMLDFISYLEETSGKGVLFIFDGFDELSPDERIKTSLCLKIIRGDKFNKCSVIVTSRPEASQFLLEQKIQFDSHLELLGFDRAQIDSCIKNSSLDKAGAANLISELKERQTILSLCNIPLNCAIVISVYGQSNTFPNTQTELFQHFLLGILKRYAMGVIRDEKLYRMLDSDSRTKNPESQSDVEQSLSAMGKLAYDGLCTNNFIFSYKDIKNCFPEGHECHKSEKPVDCFCLGLLTKSSYTTVGTYYMFLHSTLQEYLAARYCSSLVKMKDSKSPTCLLQTYIHNNNIILSKQFIMFYVGLTKPDRKVLENLLGFKVITMTDFLTYCYIIFESQTGTYQVLFNALSDKTVMKFGYNYYRNLSLMDCSVIAHFLCSTGHSWKEVNFQGCYLSAQSIDTFIRVSLLDLYQRNTPTIERIDLSNNQPSLIYELHRFPWIHETKYLKAHIQLQQPEGPKLLNLGPLTCIASLDIKASFCEEIVHQAYVNKEEVILQSIETELHEFNLKSIKVLVLRNANQRLMRSALSYIKKSKHFLNITFENCDVGVRLEDCVLMISSIESLTKLSLINVGISSRVAKKLFEALKVNNILIDLNLSCNSICTCDGPNDSCKDMLKDMLTVNKSLTTLTLKHIDADDEMVSKITLGLHSYSSLNVLNLNGNDQVSIQVATRLISCIQGNNLTSMVIHDVEITLTGTRIEHCHLKMKESNFRSLKIFCALCRSCHCEDNNKSNSIKHKLVKSVRKLDLQNMNDTVCTTLITDLFESIAIARKVHLEYLDLSWNNLECEIKLKTALELMLSKNTSLQILKMEHCGVDDDICVHSISNGLIKNNFLRQLHLSGNKITNIGAQKIFESLIHNKCLEVLDMSNNDIEFWDEDFCGSLKKMMTRNKTLKFLNLAQYYIYKCVNSIKSVDDRVLQVNIHSIPSNCNFRSLQSLFSSGFTFVNITENFCLLKHIKDSWQLTCHCSCYNLLYPEHNSDCLKCMASLGIARLHTIDLSHANVLSSDAVFIFKSLLQGENSSVELLNLSGSRIFANAGETEEVNISTKEMLGNESRCSLQTLILSNCAVSDTTCKFIADGLKKNQSLLTLDLSMNSIKGSGAIALFESLEHNSTLKVLNLADNPGIKVSEELNCVVKSTLSLNTGLQDLNMLNIIDDSMLEGIANGLYTNQKRVMKMLHIDINPLSTNTIACLLDTISEYPHLCIKGSQHCFLSQQVLKSQCDQAIQSTEQLKVFCALHQTSHVNLSDTFVAHLHTLILKNLNVDAKQMTCLFRSLQDNKWLKVLDLSKKRNYYNQTEIGGTLAVSVTASLEQMLSKNESLLCLDLCNTVSSSIALGLLKGLKKNKTLQNLHIDIESIDYDQIAKLLQVFFNSDLILMNVESVGIFHLDAENRIGELQHGVQQRSSQSSSLYYYYDILCDPCLQACEARLLDISSQLTSGSQVNRKWCVHLARRGSMLVKFYTALTRGTHLPSSGIVLQLLCSLKKVELRSHDALEFIQSLKISSELQLEHVNIGCCVKLTEEMVVTLLDASKKISILVVNAPVGDKVALSISRQLKPDIHLLFSLRRLDINVRFLSIPTVAELVNNVVTSDLAELNLSPFLYLKRELLESRSWRMVIALKWQSRSLYFIRRLYEYIQYISITNTLDIMVQQDLNDLAYNVMFRLLEDNRHLDPIVFLNSDYSQFAKILSSTQCQLRVLTVKQILGSIFKMFYRTINKPLMHLEFNGRDIQDSELNELLEILKLTKIDFTVQLTCNDSPSDHYELVLAKNFTLQFHISSNSKEVCTNISAALQLKPMSRLERLIINTMTEEIEYCTLFTSVSNMDDSHSDCALNHIEVNEMFVLTKVSKNPSNWNLELLNFQCAAFDNLFLSLSNTPNFIVLNPVLVSHYKGYVKFPFYAFDERYSRSFKIKNLDTLTTVSLYRNKSVEGTCIIGIKEFLSGMKLDTLSLYYPDNMTIVEGVISLINEKELSLKKLCIIADVNLLSNTSVLELLTALSSNILPEVSIGEYTQLKLQSESNHQMPINISDLKSLEFCKFFCILNKLCDSPLVRKIVRSIQKLDFSHTCFDSAVVVQLLQCIKNNSTLNELSLPCIRRGNDDTSLDLGPAIETAFAENISITVLKINTINQSYSCVSQEIARGLAQNSGLRCIYVDTTMISGELLKSLFSHSELLDLHICDHNGKNNFSLKKEGHWQREVLQYPSNDAFILHLFCALSKLCENCDDKIKENALPMLQSISALQTNIKYVILSELTEEFIKAVKESSTLKYLDLYGFSNNMKDKRLNTVTAILGRCSLEQLDLHITDYSQTSSFSGLCDSIKGSSYLKNLTFHLSSASCEAISVLMNEFNVNNELYCEVCIILKLSESKVTIVQCKESASWMVNLTCTDGKFTPPSLYEVKMALERVQNCNLSFCITGKVLILNLGAISSQLSIPMLQSMVAHTDTLKSLTLTGNECFAGTNSLKVTLLCELLSSSPNLVILNMTMCSIDDSACVKIANELKSNTSLKGLVLSCNKIQCSGAIELFQALKGNSTLIEFSLSDNNQVTHGDSETQVAAAIADMLKAEESSLKFLDLSNCDISDIVCEGIACGLLENTKLKELLLKQNKFTVRGITELLKSAKCLEYLDLSCNPQLAITGNDNEIGQAFEHMLRSNTFICSLSLRRSINDKIAKLIIAGLRFHQSVRELDVAYCQLSADVLSNLIASCEYNSFKTLHVADVRCEYEECYDKFDQASVSKWSIVEFNVERLFFLLILSHHQQATTTGQLAYRKVHNITQLDLRDRNLSSSQFFSLIESLRFIPNLKELNLSKSTQVSGDTVEASNKVCCALNQLLLHKQIKSLSIACIGIHPTSWQHLFSGLSSASSQLRVLDISDNPLGDEGSVALLKMLSHFGGVIKINIHECNVSSSYFSNSFIDIITSQGFKMTLNCNQHQLSQIQSINLSLEAFEVTSEPSYD